MRLCGCRRSAGRVRPRTTSASRKTCSAHTLAALARAASKGGASTTDALRPMRLRLSAQDGSPGANSPRGIAAPVFPRPCTERAQRVARSRRPRPAKAGTASPAALPSDHRLRHDDLRQQTVPPRCCNGLGFGRRPPSEHAKAVGGWRTEPGPCCHAATTTTAVTGGRRRAAQERLANHIPANSQLRKVTESIGCECLVVGSCG